MIEDSRKDEEKDWAARTFYSFHDDSTAGEGRWAQGSTLLGDAEIQFERGGPLDDDVNQVPAPDPLLFSTYDGSLGTPKPGTAGGAFAQGDKNLLSKAKDTITPDD